jgi:ParB/RepB/Spo0J family partition protein
MSKKRTSRSVIVSGLQVLDIPLAQLRPDPNQPRTTFDEEELAELTSSIKAQGLQQLPTVNLAFVEDGISYYYIKAGERRFRAHKRLGMPTMRCFVEPEPYNGTFDVGRKLAQAAENSSRARHTHGEIIAVMEDVLKAEIAVRGESHNGSVEIAMGKVAAAFGKSRAWAMNYYTLIRLHPDLRLLLDRKEDGERLNFGVAMALARIPSERQQELLAQAQHLKQKGGHNLMYRFIVRQAQALREQGGKPTRGRKPSDDKAVMENMMRSLNRMVVGFLAERKPAEHKKFLDGLMSQMRTHEVDYMLSQVNLALVTFGLLQAVLKEKRESLYSGLKVVK